MRTVNPKGCSNMAAAPLAEFEQEEAEVTEVNGIRQNSEVSGPVCIPLLRRTCQSAFTADHQSAPTVSPCPPPSIALCVTLLT